MGALGALAYQYFGGGGGKRKKPEEEEKEEEAPQKRPTSPRPTSPRNDANPLKSPRKGGEGTKSGPLSRVSSKESFTVDNPLSISRSGSASSLPRSPSKEFRKKN